VSTELFTEEDELEEAMKEADEIDLWERYEQRKALLSNIALTAKEYYDACQRIADELGI
jgi:uncharacterized protein YutE (UPF0331/DUF86 family)